MMSVSFIYPEALYLLLALPLVVGPPLLRRRRLPGARHWGSLALRILIVLLLVLGVAGAQIVRKVDELTVVFVVDASDSVPQEQQERAAGFIRQSMEAMQPRDKAAVVVFGKNALVEQLASDKDTLDGPSTGAASNPSSGSGQGLASVPISTRTNIAEALRLAQALFPGDSEKRIVLLSDGEENVGKAAELAPLLAARDIQVMTVPLSGPQEGVEVSLETLEAPAHAREGQSLELTTVVYSTARTSGRLQVLADGDLVHSQDMRLQEGRNRFSVPVEAGEPGFRRFRAHILPDQDTRLQNNEAGAFTVVHGPPRVLLVEGVAGEASELNAALGAAGVKAEVIPSETMPATLERLNNFDAVVLVNGPARSLPEGAMDALQTYVRDLGRGLVMIGGEYGYGAGGYLRTPLEETLPVDMDVRSQTHEPNLALVVAVDKSGSMGRCHCDDPDAQPGSYERVESGLPKVDIAKEAIMRASEVLGPLDYLGVVAFDEVARWAIETQQLPDPAAIERAIANIGAEGGTNIFTGLAQAEETLVETDARVKHIILLTDGWSRHGSYDELTERLEEEEITLSVVAAGQGSAEYLRKLAEQGGGHYYPAVGVRDVPDIFLKETIKATGSYIIEEPFHPLPASPSPIMHGLDTVSLPPLLGYNGTTAKETARVALLSARGDPVLATWQYGLGRAAAWTSDATGRWAVDWVNWEGFPRFAAQLVSWVLPAPQDEGLNTEVILEGSRVVFTVESVDDEGRPRNFLETEIALIGPNLEKQEAALSQKAAGQYQGSIDISQPGTYLVQVVQKADGEPVARQTIGVVVPYSPEYRAVRAESGLLSELARVTGGASLPDPTGAFAHTLEAVEQALEIWPTLLLVAALLFPLDVAVRRVMLGLGDLQQAVAWVRERFRALGLSKGPERRGPQREPILGRLFQARERGRRKLERGNADEERPGAQPPEAPSATGRRTEGPPPEPAPSSDDVLARLREAKQRARRRD